MKEESINLWIQEAEWISNRINPSNLCQDTCNWTSEDKRQKKKNLQSSRRETLIWLMKGFVSETIECREKCQFFRHNRKRTAVAIVISGKMDFKAKILLKIKKDIYVKSVSPFKNNYKHRSV